MISEEDKLLLKAARLGYMSVVAAVLKAGANVEALDKWGHTALYIAAREGHIDVVNFLINAGADINAHGKTGWTPLIVSVLWVRTEVVQLLIDKGADREIRTDESKTALQHAEECFNIVCDPFSECDDLAFSIAEYRKIKEILQQ